MRRTSRTGAVSSLEPLVLHYLEQGDLTKVETLGENVRVTFQVKDRWLAIARETDPERLRKNLEGTPNSPHFIAEQVANLERLQTMAPMRVVAFLLDPRHGYGVAEREEWTAAGQRIVRIQSEDWKYYESVGIWLPSRCVASYYAHPLTLSEFSDQPILTITHQLRLVEFGQEHSVCA